MRPYKIRQVCGRSLALRVTQFIGDWWEGQARSRLGALLSSKSPTNTGHEASTETRELYDVYALLLDLILLLAW